MPKLFATDSCLSGQCVCRQLLEALLIERELANPKNHTAEKRRVQELLNAGGRLMAEQEQHMEPDMPNFSSGPCGGV